VRVTDEESLRRRLLEFQLELDVDACEQLQEHDWGRAFLCPSLPLIWDANWVLIEEPGVSARDAISLGDEVLGGAGYLHRTICFSKDAGSRLREEAEALPGWQVERTVYLVWDGETEPATAPGVDEVALAQIEDLRRELIREDLPPGIDRVEETVEQLLELDRRYGAVAGDRWFVAPGAADPASACRLMARGAIGQIEDVATVTRARERGFAKATVGRAHEASRADGHETTFILALVDDWPRLIYEKLGFAPTGELQVLRKAPL
jgi:GNAT superfamily N-acetyltransferase